MISLETPQRKWASYRLEGRTSRIFSSFCRSSRLRREPQGPALVASGKASPHGVARGPLGIPLPSMPEPKTLCGVGAETLGFLSSADMDLGVLLESPQGSQSSSRVGACTCPFLSSCSSSVTLPFAWIKGSVAFPRGFPTRLSHEAFPRGIPTGLSHVPPWCESILGLKVKAVQGKLVSLEWTQSFGGLWEW